MFFNNASSKYNVDFVDTDFVRTLHFNRHRKDPLMRTQINFADFGAGHISNDHTRCCLRDREMKSLLRFSDLTEGARGLARV